MQITIFTSHPTLGFISIVRYRDSSTLYRITQILHNIEYERMSMIRYDYIRKCFTVCNNHNRERSERVRR